MARKDMCPDYVAFKISMVLEDEATAQLVPTDLLIKAIRCKRVRDASIYTSKKYRSSFYS